MVSISDQLERVSRIPSDALLGDNGHQLDLEWWVLGKVAACLDAAGDIAPQFAVPGQPPAPDFLVSTAEGQVQWPVEITEILTPGRKRMKEYREIRAADEPDRYSFIGEPRFADADAWRLIADAIAKKAGKNYPKSTWLLIYHNMWAFDMAGWPRDWPDYLFRAIAKEATVADILHLIAFSPFDRVLVLDSGGTGLASIYPEVRLIKARIPPAD